MKQEHQVAEPSHSDQSDQERVGPLYLINCAMVMQSESCVIARTKRPGSDVSPLHAKGGEDYRGLDF
jgi:hypothetical protein